MIPERWAEVRFELEYAELDPSEKQEVFAHIEAQAAKIDAVKALHEPVTMAAMDGTRDTTVCGACGVIRGGYVYTGKWPCATIQALDATK